VKAGSGAWTSRMKYTFVQSNEEKISPKWVRRGLIELSTMSNGSTLRPGWRAWALHPLGKCWPSLTDLATRLSHGFVEGKNNRPKALRRQGYGYANRRHLRLRILLEAAS